MDDIKKKLGQLLFVGIASTSLDQGEKKFLKEFNIGGVILFKRNYESLGQLIELTSEINALTKNKPFIGVDQEGGKVIRFGEPFTQFPPVSVIGKSFEKTDSLKFTEEYAQITASELKASGLNLCFVPVLDILTNPKNVVIGNRAFSSDTRVVSEMGSAVINVFKKNKVLSCAKHFPGHGDTLLDSHETLPKTDFKLDSMMKRELVPFKRAVDEGVPMIMTAHVLYESIDGKYPATLSRTILKDILRGKLRYENLVISDDFEMKGLSNSFDVEEAAVLAVEGGVDILLICHSLEKMYRVYEALMKKAGNIDFRDRILESVRRVDRIKKAYDVGRVKPDIKNARSAFDGKRSRELIEKMKAFT